jgi:hypothetical protein
MNSPRETIYAALFALVSGAVPFVTTSRRAQIITQMQPSALPALFQTQTGEDTQQSRGIPPKYVLRVDITLYAINPDPAQPATPQLNALIDAVEAALAPNPVTGVQSLGGLVSHCYIGGKTDIFEGNLGNRAAAVIPVEILTT